MKRIINTPNGPIEIVAQQKYSLSSLICLKTDQIQPFFSIFKIDHNNQRDNNIDKALSDLIQILHTNNLIKGDSELINHPQFFFWIAKSEDEIQKIMSEKGIWFPGMNKYFGLRILLLSHSIVQQNKDQNTIDSPSDHPEHQMNDMNPSPQNKDIIDDTRTSITKGPHYETLPDWDFNIHVKRDLARSHFGNTMLTSFSGKDLQVLYELYDKYTFKNELSRMLKEKGCAIKFGSTIISNTKVGEHKYSYSDNTHTIRISQHMIGKLFTKGEKSIKSNGLIIMDRLAGLMNVFEHEITHLYCNLKGYTRKIKKGQGKMYYSPHGKLFQELVFRFFGHTDFRHDFNNGEASNQLNRSECRVGMCIYFDSNKRGKIYGRIIKCNSKRAKIDTEDGSSFDVPYSMLRRADRNVVVPKKKTLDIDSIKQKYRVGMKVKFKHNKKYVSGKIIKCNPKRARVESSIGTYDMSYSLLL